MPTYNDDVTAAADGPNQAPGTAPTIQIAIGGAFVKLRLPGHPPLSEKWAPRGPIRRFSKAARKRLVETFLKIDRTAVRFMPLFITLTYPADFPADTKECKRHLDVFCKRLTRRFRDASIVWKMEYQKRQAPHFHLLVWNVRFIRYEQVALDWYETVGSGLKEHLAAGTRVERVRSWRGVLFYAAKYLGKVGGEIADETPGRFWGIIGRRHLPTRLLVFALGWSQAYWLRGALLDKIGRPGDYAQWAGRWAGVTAYLPWRTGLDLLNTS